MYLHLIDTECNSTDKFSFILFNDLYRFLGENEIDNLTVSNSESTTDLPLSKIGFL